MCNTHDHNNPQQSRSLHDREIDDLPGLASLSLSLAAEAQPGGKQSRLFLALFDLSLTVINKQANKQTNKQQTDPQQGVKRPRLLLFLAVLRV